MANPFAPRFYGQLRATSRGTDVMGSVRVPLPTVVFFTVWFGVVLFVALMSILATPWSVPTTGAPADLARFVGYPIIVGSGIALIAFGRKRARGEDAELVRFVCDTLVVTEGTA